MQKKSIIFQMGGVVTYVLLPYRNTMTGTLDGFSSLMFPNSTTLCKVGRVPDFGINFANHLCDLIIIVDGFDLRGKWQPRQLELTTLVIRLFLGTWWLNNIINGRSNNNIRRGKWLLLASLGFGLERNLLLNLKTFQRGKSWSHCYASDHGQTGAKDNEQDT